MIPDFQSIMLPLLERLRDKAIMPVSLIRDAMVKHFSVTEEEQNIKIPSGRQYQFYNRIAWAISYLKMAELVSSPERSLYQITKSGIELLDAKPSKVTIKLLKKYPKFNENRRPAKPNIDDDGDNDETKIEERTPDELIEIGYNKIRDDLSSQLLALIKANTPQFFEGLVIDLLLSMGYGGNRIEYGELVGKPGDEGIDGIIKEDKLGLDKIYIQAKKWENSVGRPDIQKFVGALQGKRAKKGIFITTSQFSKEARDYSNNVDSNIVLIDGEELTQFMIDHELGVSVKQTLKICRVDSDYFEA